MKEASTKHSLGTVMAKHFEKKASTEETLTQAASTGERKPLIQRRDLWSFRRLRYPCKL